MSPAGSTVASVIEAASLLIVSPGKRVLFMLRPSRGSYANTHVFPGGALEAQDHSLLHCALRETFEETGILIDPISRRSKLLAPSSDSYESALGTHFHRQLAQVDWTSKLGFPKMSRWTTPKRANNKRFSTQFFLYNAPEQFDFSKFIETREAVKLEWMLPEDAIRGAQEKQIVLFPPQFYIMTYLSELGAQRASGLLEDRVIKPRTSEMLDDGRVKMDWGNGEFGLVRFENGSATDIEFKRNTKL